MPIQTAQGRLLWSYVPAVGSDSSLSAKYPNREDGEKYQISDLQ